MAIATANRIDRSPAQERLAAKPDPMPVVYYEGDRIYFRPIEQTDEPLLRKWINDPAAPTTVPSTFQAARKEATGPKIARYAPHGMHKLTAALRQKTAGKRSYGRK